MAAPRVLDAYRDGLRRVRAAPWIWTGAWLTSLSLAVPLGLVLREMLGAHLGASLAGDAAAAGVNWEWWQEFRAQASGIGTTFAPSILGFAAVLRNLSDLVDNERMATVIAGVVTAWLVVWSFLAGGMIDRYARDRALGTTAFFAACGTHFWRLLRLGIVALLLYATIFGGLHPLLFDDGLYEWLTKNLASERTAFGLRVFLYALVVAALVVVNVVIDYARVRMVVEDRRSAVFALSAGLRFVNRHRRGVAGLYFLNTAGFLLVLAAYALIAPRASQVGPGMWLAFAVGQVYIALRLGVKLGFYATQTAYFQQALAHATYVAAPLPDWPDSPAAEAIWGDAPASPTVP